MMILYSCFIPSTYCIPSILSLLMQNGLEDFVATRKNIAIIRPALLQRREPRGQIAAHFPVEKWKVRLLNSIQLNIALSFPPFVLNSSDIVLYKPHLQRLILCLLDHTNTASQASGGEISNARSKATSWAEHRSSSKPGWEPSLWPAYRPRTSRNHTFAQARKTDVGNDQGLRGFDSANPRPHR